MGPMARTSAGVLLYRRTADGVEVLIGHMGGPFWAKKDAGGWSIPKGEYGDGEEAFAVALREFEEEVGSPCPATEFRPLGEVRAGGKVLTIWAGEGDLDAAACVSNTFELEWPPRSGRTQSYPEIDRVEWLELDAALRKISPAQRPLLARLDEAVAGDGAPR
jgi:predicted NUDIX family NTP pyrophosphohydrolase